MATGSQEDAFNFQQKDTLESLSPKKRPYVNQSKVHSPFGMLWPLEWQIGAIEIVIKLIMDS